MDFQVNYSTLGAAAADINVGAANLQNCLGDFGQTLNQLHSSWGGQTQEAYGIVQRQWDQDLEGLKGVLCRTSSTVDSAHSDHQQADQSNVAHF